MAVTKVYSPDADEGFLSLQVENGGTSARTPAQAAENLGVVTTDQIGQTDGVCLLDEGGFVKRSDCPNSFPDPSLPVLYGEHSFYKDKELRLQIVNYDMYVDYQVNTSQMGSSNYVLDQGLIIITHNGNPVGLQTLNINGRLFEYEILERKPYVPYITNLAWVNLDGYNQFGQNLPFSGQLFTSSPFGDFTNTLTHSYTRWQVSTEPTFGTIAFESSDPGEKDNITITFSPDTDYYLRMAHIATNGVSSGWSDVYKLHTTKLAVINTPAITTPANNATGVQINPTLFSTPYSVTDFAGVHVSTDWQVATDAAFTNIVFSSISDQVNKESIQVNSGLNYAGMYYARCRHKADIAASNGTSYSEWSPVVKFTAMADNRVVQTPSVDVSGGQFADTKPMITGTAFTPQNYTDTHVSTDWQIATDAAFTNIVASSIGNTVSKTQWQPTAALANNTTYYARARYNGSIKSSGYSAGKQFKTVQAGTGITTVYDYSQDVAKPFGITQVRLQLVGGGGGGSGYAYNTDMATMEYGAAGQYVDSGWIGVTQSASSFTLDIRPRPGVQTDQGSGYAKGVDGYATAISGLLSYSASGGVGGYAVNSSRLTSIPSAFPFKSNLNYGDGALGAGYTAAFTVASTKGERGAIAITFDTEKAPNTPTLYVSGGNSSVSRSPSFSSTSYTTSDRFPNHVSSDWEIATDSGFTNIVKSSYNDTVNKTTWSSSGLSYSSTYFVRVRHHSRYTVSAWSGGVQFTTMADNRYIQTPSLSLTYPFDPDSDGNRRPVPTASGFVPVNFPGPHESSDWQIWSEPNFTPGVGVYETYADSSKLYSIESAGRWVFMYPKAGVYYYARVRFRSQGIVSGWSTTLEYYVPAS